MIFDESENITLAIEVKKDEYNPEIFYDWQVSTISDDSVFVNSNSVTSNNTNTVSIPGYSKVIIDEEDFNEGVYYISDKNNKYIRATEYDINNDYYKDNAGWYGVNVSSKLNRKNEILSS
jgi:hypothetical protein